MPVSTLPEIIQTDAQSRRSAVAARPALPVLTSLRFFAAAAVFAFHWNWHDLRRLPIVAGLASAGPEAVLFFFILSGFILNYVYLDSKAKNGLRVGNREFWKARFARIGPVYYLGLLLSLPILFYSVYAAHIASPQDLLICLIAVPVFLQAWWPPVGGLWNAPGWTLSVECFFYACFPLIRMTTRRIPPVWFLMGAYSVVIAFAAFGRDILNLVEYKDHIYFPILHLPSFVFGMALSDSYLHAGNFSRKFSTFVFYIAVVITVLIFAFRMSLPRSLFNDPILIALFGIVIYCGVTTERQLKIFAHPMLRLLGEASYAMYILHMPIMQYWSLAVTRLHPRTSLSNLELVLSFLGCFSLIVALSTLSYLYFERPMRRRILGHNAHKSA